MYLWLQVAVCVRLTVGLGPGVDPGLGPGLGHADTVRWLQALAHTHTWTWNASDHVADTCAQAMATYGEELRGGALWALTMADASGRYPSAFLFGDDYWLGSRTLCHGLESVATPFKVRYLVLRLRVSVEGVTLQGPRTLLLGLCLPDTCQPSHVTAAAQRTWRSEGGREVHVVGVRAVPGDYPLLEDARLCVLGAVTVVLLLLMAAGTAYDMYVRGQHNLSEVKASEDRGQHALSEVKASEGRGQHALSEVKASGNEGQHALSEGKASEDKGQHGVSEVKASGDRGQQGVSEVKASGDGVQQAVSEVTQDHVTCSKPQRGPLGVWPRVLLAFSAVTNSERLLTSRSSEVTITCVHGLRVLSLAWVVLVHTYLVAFSVADNKALRAITERRPLYQTIGNATFSVDTFFCLSGLLLAYLYRRAPRQSRSPLPRAWWGRLLLLVLPRLARLTPPYLYVLGAAGGALAWVAHVSVFPPPLADHVTCPAFWWRNALYINSLFPREDMCMLWSWYLANDMQFFVLGVLLLLLAARYPRVAVTSWLVLVVTSCCTTAYVAFRHGYLARVDQPFALFDALYDKPWTRVSAFLVGLGVGWLLGGAAPAPACPRTGVLASGVLAAPALLAMAALVYALLPARPGHAASAAYAATGHCVWAAAVGGVVAVCHRGYGGVINSLLSARTMVPLSRLTYCAYLVHPIIMVLVTHQLDGPLHLHNTIVVVLFFGFLVASFAVAFLLSLLIEAPLVQLIKIAVAGARTK